jgi:uncharacterized protein (DUF1778 family)
MDKASASPKLNVRLEEDLRCLLEAAAERSLRSLSAEIRYRLRCLLEAAAERSLRSLSAEIRYRLRRSLEQPEPAAA